MSIEKRPLLFISLIYTLGILLGYYLSSPSLFVIFCTIVLVIKVTYSIIPKYKFYLFLVLALVFVFSATYIKLKLSIAENKAQQLYEQTTFEAKVISEPQVEDYKVSYVIKFNNVRLKGLLNIYTTRPDTIPSYDYGTILSIKGTAKEPKKNTNSKVFNYKKYLQAQDIYVIVTTSEPSILILQDSPSISIIKSSIFCKNYIISVIDNLLPENTANLMNGMFIGYDDKLSPEMKDNFSISGLSHIMCISGSNIAFITIFFLKIFKFFKLNLKNSHLLIIVIIVLFTYITGFSATIIRASIMGIIILIAKIIDRQSDIYTSLSVSILFILIYNPMTLFSVAFQLSVIGVISLITIYPRLYTRLSFLPQNLNQILSSTLSAQLILAPIIMFYFNTINIYSVITNLLVVPITALITSFGTMLCICSLPFLLPIAKIIAYLCNVLLLYIINVTTITGTMPYSQILCISPTIINLLIYYVFIYMPKTKKTLHYFAILVIIIKTFLFVIPKPLEVNFIDVGQGDAIIIKTPSRKTFLLDGGGVYQGNTDYDISELLIPYLLKNETSTIDVAILSHPHNDHIQGLISVISTLKVKQLIVSPYYENELFNELLLLAKEKGINIITVQKGDSIKIDNILFDVLHPSSSQLFDNPNNNSLVLRMSYYNHSILFTGDIEKEVENGLNQNIMSAVLKVAHHGSNTSSTIEFIEKVNPKLSIISCGTNRYGHPSSETLKNLSNTKLYRTDLNGEIKLKLTKNKIKASCYILSSSK